MSDIWSDPEVVAYLKYANDQLRPMIDDSAYTMSIMADAEPDAKQALEIGFTLLLGKPLMLVVQPGTKVPAGLVKAAEEIVEVDFRSGEFSDRDAAAIRSALSRMANDG